jgi:hypothetical protein
VKRVIKIIIITGTVLIFLFLLYFFLFEIKRPIGESYSYYYKNSLGMIYEGKCTSTLGVLCISNKYTKLDVDDKTFEVLIERGGFVSTYGKDVNSVYHKGKTIEGADTNSFKLISWGLAKDKETLYMDGFEIREYAKRIDPSASINEGVVELLEFNPPYYIKLSVGDEIFIIYYTGRDEERRVVKLE